MAKSSGSDRDRDRESEHEECTCEHCGRIEEDHHKKHEKELDVDVRAFNMTIPNVHLFTLKCRKSKRELGRVILDLCRISDAEEAHCGGTEVYLRETDNRIQRFLVKPRLERVYEILKGIKHGRDCD